MSSSEPQNSQWKISSKGLNRKVTRLTSPTFLRMWQIFEQSDPSDPSSMFMFGHGGSDGTIAWAIPSEDLIVVYFTQSRGGNTRDEIGRVVEKAFGADWFE